MNLPRNNKNLKIQLLRKKIQGNKKMRNKIKEKLLKNLVRAKSSKKKNINLQRPTEKQQDKYGSTRLCKTGPTTTIECIAAI